MNKYLYAFFLLIISVSLYVFEKENMFKSDIIESTNFLATSMVLVMLFFSILGLFLSKRQKLKTNILVKFTCLIIWVYFISLIYVINNPFSSRSLFGLIILSLLLFYFISRYSVYIDNDNFIIWIMTFVFLLLSYYFIYNYNNNILYRVDKQNNASYIVLYLLPFLLCHKRNIFRILALLICSFVIMYSLKRGGLIALLLSVLVYVIVSQNQKIKRFVFFRILILLPIVIFACYYLLVYFNENLNGVLFARLEDSVDSGGSGRLDIYEYYLNSILDSSILHIFFGRGWEGTLRVGKMDLTAHNDFLEVFINFGLVGFIFYLSFIISLIRLCVKMIKNNHEYAPAMAVSLAIFFINSTVSHIFVYPRYMIVFAIFWGFIIYSNCSIKNKNYIK